MRVIRTNGIKGTSAVNKTEKPRAVEGATFSALMGDRQQQQTREELEQLMKEIKADGEKLVDERNIEVLVDYKKKVRAFVSKAVDFAYDIKDKKGVTRFGRGKILKTVSLIDNTLDQLTREFLNEERARITMLENIGELQGLLYNIYA